MKRFSAVIASVALAFALAGCAESGEEEGNTEEGVTTQEPLQGVEGEAGGQEGEGD